MSCVSLHDVHGIFAFLQSLEGLYSPQSQGATSAEALWRQSVTC